LLSPDDLWLGLASFEYLENHELVSSRPVHLLVLPTEGRKGELDAWLGESVASTQTEVNTYDMERRESQQLTQSILLLFAAVESIIAFVAAIALATLNHIFFIQRREEFGTLHALGRSRLWLVLRTVKETGSAVAVAWLIGAAVCVVGLVFTQTTIYAPRGLSLDFTNLVPWIFTLPIPLTVIVVGAGTIARTLRRLDPVAVIERR
jgi:ABC-type antimicrobial peptide transport system permease subunit